MIQRLRAEEIGFFDLFAFVCWLVSVLIRGKTGYASKEWIKLYNQFAILNNIDTLTYAHLRVAKVDLEEVAFWKLGQLNDTIRAF